MDRHLSSSNFNDQLKAKDVSDNLVFQSKRGHFLNRDMKQELIQVLATKEAHRILRKTSLKDISKVLERQSKLNGKIL